MKFLKIIIRIILTPFIWYGLILKCTGIFILETLTLCLAFLVPNEIIVIPFMFIFLCLRFLYFIFLGLIRLITKYIPYGSKTLKLIFLEGEFYFKENPREKPDFSQFKKENTKKEEIIEIKEDEYEIIEENEAV